MNFYEMKNMYGTPHGTIFFEDIYEMKNMYGTSHCTILSEGIKFWCHNDVVIPIWFFNSLEEVKFWFPVDVAIALYRYGYVDFSTLKKTKKPFSFMSYLCHYKERDF